MLRPREASRTADHDAAGPALLRGAGLDEAERLRGHPALGAPFLFGDPLARLRRPAQLREVAAFLAALTPEELTRRHDPARMTALETHPHRRWLRPAADGRAALDSLLDAFHDPRPFVPAAVAAGDAVAVCVA